MKLKKKSLDKMENQKEESLLKIKPNLEESIYKMFFINNNYRNNFKKTKIKKNYY